MVCAMLETASLHSPSLGIEIPCWLSWDPPREGFSGLRMGQPPLQPTLGRHRGNQALRAEGMEYRDGFGAGILGFLSPVANREREGAGGRYRLRQIKREGFLTCKKWK